MYYIHVCIDISYLDSRVLRLHTLHITLDVICLPENKKVRFAMYNMSFPATYRAESLTNSTTFSSSKCASLNLIISKANEEVLQVVLTTPHLGSFLQYDSHPKT